MKKNNKLKISVIIPIYNREDSILRCLSSIQNQTFRNIEIICVDDCSSDNSKNILKKLTLKDDRIVILENKNNVGPGVSRNNGVDIAKGDYLIFVDADDYIDNDLLEALCNKAISGSFDVVKCNHLYKCKNGRIIDMEINRNIRNDLSKGKPLWVSFTSEHQGTLYKKELFIDKNIRYGSTYMSEDSIFLLKLGHKTNSIGFLDSNDTSYYRIQTDGSLTNVYSNRVILEQILEVFHKLLDFIKDEAYTENAMEYVIKKTIYLLSIHRYISSYESNNDLSCYFLKRVKNEIESFPSIDIIKQENTTIKMLIDYEVNLCKTSHVLPWTIEDMVYYENIVEEWMKFAYDHTELKEYWYPELVNILSRINVLRKFEIQYFNDSNILNNYAIFLNNELKNCSLFTKPEKLLIKTIMLIRKNNVTNKIFTNLKHLLDKAI